MITISEKQELNESSSEKKQTIGLIEPVTLYNKDRSITLPALIDTGATRTSIDKSIAKELGISKIVGKVNVKSKTEKNLYRDLVVCDIEIKGKRFTKKVSLSNRKDMFTKVLIGRDIIHNNFIVDISLTHNSQEISDIKDPK